MSANQPLSRADDVVERLCSVLSDKTGLSPEELIAASSLTDLEQINSIVLADALDEVEEMTGKQVDGSRMTPASLETIRGMAGLYS